jgi:uncharacterized membrane protein
MNLPPGLLPDAWYVGGWLVLVACLGWHLRVAPWASLTADGRLHAWLGSIVALTLLWSMQAGVRPGLGLHLLGASAALLAFGPHLATLALCAVLVAVSVNSGSAASAFGLNAVLLACVPVALAAVIERVVRRLLPQQVFVFIFANGFFGAAITVFAGALGGALVLVAGGAYPLAVIIDEYLPFAMLLAFSEAWLSGMAVTLLVVYRPEWIRAYDERSHHLRR